MTAALYGPHKDIVDDLEQMLDGLCGEDWRTPRVALLSGPSGSGKTRIVRELFERLRTRGGTEDNYWPAFGDDERTGGAGLDPMATRKLIAPPLDHGWQWPAGALPGFGWWGLNCERLSSGTPQELLASLEPQWEMHSLPLVLARRQTQDLSDKLRSGWASLLKASRQAVVGEGMGLAQGAALGALGLAFPGATALTDVAIGQVKALRRTVQERSARTQDLDRSTVGRDRDVKAAQELADLIRGLAHPKLPAVVVIEDIHLMGPGLDEFIRRLAESSPASPVLVIGTVWPERLQSPPFSDWHGAAEEAGIVYEPFEVPRLGAGDLAQIVLDHAGRTPRKTAQRIAEHFDGNPLFLKLWLTDDLIARRIGPDPQSGEIALSEDTAVVLPRDIRTVMEGRWDALPEDTRDALLHAMIANPVEQSVGPGNSDLDVSAPFPIDIITRVIAARTSKTSSEALAALHGAVEPARWCVTDDDGRQMFLERGLADVARDRAEELRTRQFGNEDWFLPVREHVTEALEQWLLEHRDGATELHEPVLASLVARWYVEITDGRNLGGDVDTARTAADSREASERSPRPLALGLAFRRLAEDAAARRETLQAVMYGDSAVAAFQDAGLPMRNLWRLRSWVSDLAGRGREHGLAVDRAESLLADIRTALPEKDFAVLSARFWLAWWQGLQGDPTAAVEEIWAVARADEDDDGYFAMMTSEFELFSGHASDEADHLSAELADTAALLGDDDPATLAVRRRFVSRSLHCGGSIADGIEQLTILLDSQRRTLGIAHPDTQWSLDLMLEYGIGFQDFEEELTVATELLDGRRALLGAEHPLTRTTRDHVELTVESRELSRLTPELTDEDWQQGLRHQLEDLDPEDVEEMTMLERVWLLRKRAGK